MARLEGKVSLGRLGLLIHSTAGYVDPGWKGNLTLELSNVANLPIALYHGMRIGQITLLRDVVAGRAAVRVARARGRGTRASRSRPPRRSTGTSRPAARPGSRPGPSAMAHQRRRRLARRPRAAARRVALVQAGTFRSDAGTLFGPVPWVLWGDLVADEIDDQRRLLQALNCLLIETPLGPGAGRDRHRRAASTTRRAAMRVYEGPWIVPALETAGFLPETVNVVAMSHLHFDHAGGLLRADGDAGLPARDDRRPEGRVGGRARRQPAAGRLVRPAGAHASSRTGAPRAGPTARRELMPGVSVVPTGGHSTGHQAIIVRGTGDGARTVAFFGDLFMRPWAANPRWVTAFDDFPLDSVVAQGRAVRPGRRRGLDRRALPRARHPVGRLVRDRDRFRYEAI